MAKFYKSDKIELDTLIEASTNSTGATILIPNLQRAYVWGPHQVSLLVDSLVRGWPFGSLLLWAVDPKLMSVGGLPPMPKRSLWFQVSNVPGVPPKGMPEAKNPTPYRMVLDGQQRLQSLLLAFKGTNYGFALYDHAWAESLGLPPRKQTSHWCRGCLCVDLERLASELVRLKVIEWVDFFNAVLKWVVIDPRTDESPGRTVAQPTPIPELTFGSPIVPLAKFWDRAVITDVKLPGKYDADIDAILDEYGIKNKEQFTSCCEHLLHKLDELKGIEVEYLQVVPYSSGFNLDKYNEAVISIFTRLNSAGRELSPQEITFAWIKMNWIMGTYNGNREADRCFKELGEDLKAKGNLNLDIDNLVRGMSAVWASLFSQGMLLDDKDLLKGDKLKPMASDLGNRWNDIAASVVDMSARISNLGLRYRETYYSLNALFILWCLESIIKSWPAFTRLNTTEKDSFDKDYELLLTTNIDRWFFLSQWSNTWAQAGESKLQGYLKELSSLRTTLDSITAWNDAIHAITKTFTGWIDAFKLAARNNIDAMSATSRGSVRQYFGPLWIWNKLYTERWEIAKVHMREFHRRPSKLLETDVDHIVAVKLWESGTNGAPLPDEAGIINSIGNCCLLERTFNISKSAEPAYDFFVKVNEFRTGEITFADFERHMRIDISLLKPKGLDKLQLAIFIKKREENIKNDLKKYVDGVLSRVDL